MSTVTLPGETAAPAAHKADLYRVIVLAVLAATLGVFIVAFTSEKLLFSVQRAASSCRRAEVGTLGIIAGIPSYLQPFMGAFSDLNPLFGYHRRSYFVLGGIISALGYLLLALQAHYAYGAVVALVTIAAAGGIMVNVVFNAVLVVVGNATGTFGRLQTLLYFISYGWVLAYTGHLTGHVTQDWSYRLAFECAAAFSLAGTLLVWLIPERRARHEASVAPEDLLARNAARQEERQRTLAVLQSAAASPGLWVLVVFIFYLIVTPGTNTAQVYYETDALHLSKQFIGDLRSWTAAGVIAALALYGAASNRLSARALVFGAWLMDCAAYLLLLNIHNAASAEWVSLLVAASGTIYGLCLYTLAGRACPVGAEGAVYGLVLSAIALGGASSATSWAVHSMMLLAPQATTPSRTAGLPCSGSASASPSLRQGLIPFLPAWARSGERLGSTVQEPAP